MIVGSVDCCAAGTRQLSWHSLRANACSIQQHWSNSITAGANQLPVSRCDQAQARGGIFHLELNRMHSGPLPVAGRRCLPGRAHLSTCSRRAAQHRSHRSIGGHTPCWDALAHIVQPLLKLGGRTVRLPGCASRCRSACCCGGPLGGTGAADAWDCGLDTLPRRLLDHGSLDI